MKHHCYIQMREFGSRGWNKLVPALLISDRVDTWIPSGIDLQAANRENYCPLTEKDVVELMEAGVVRAGVRPENIGRNPAIPVFLSSSDSLLDNYLISHAGSASVLLHQANDSAAVALKEIANRAAAIGDSHYRQARNFVERHLAGKDDCVPEFVMERAEQFGDPDRKIVGSDIRECVKLIKEETSSDPMERKILLICSQLIRLAIEHDRLKEAHGCNIHFAQAQYAATLQTVANAAPVNLRLREPLRSTLDQIVDLIDFLLHEKPIQSAADVLTRRKRIETYRGAIWNLAAHNVDAARHLVKGARDVNPWAFAFGNDSVARSLSGARYAISTAQLLVAASTDPSMLFTAGTLSWGLSQASAMWSVGKAEQNRLASDAIWLGMVVYNVDKPTREQMRQIAGGLKRYIVEHSELFESARE